MLSPQRHNLIEQHATFHLGSIKLILTGEGVEEKDIKTAD